MELDLLFSVQIIGIVNYDLLMGGTLNNAPAHISCQSDLNIHNSSMKFIFSANTTPRLA